MKVSNSNLGRLLIASSLALALTMFGCGGDSGSDTQPKEKFTAQAKQVCENAENEKINIANEELKKDPSLAKEEDVLVQRAAIPPLKQEINELEELPPPETGADEAEALIDALAVAVDKLEEDPEGLRHGRNPFEETAQMAKKIGIPTCGEG